MGSIKHTLNEVFVNHFEVKAVLAFLAMASSWVLDNEYQAVIALLSLRAIDFGTGTYYALKSGTWTSGKSFDGFKKTGVYLTFILVSRLVDKALPIHIWAPAMDMYLAVTEGGSILENLKKLGYDIPSALISKLMNTKRQ